METVAPLYDGREQALVKHTLLKSYLEKLVLIIGSSARGKGPIEICYVDCFAGPWGTENKRLEGTSISISLQTLAACRITLAELGANVAMRALFIEKHKKPFSQLKRYLSECAPPSVKAECKRGDFVDLRGEILDWCGPDSFAFFFVDPTGWKAIGIETMTPLVQRERSEFLINFAYNNINRTMSMEEWKKPMLDLLGKEIDVAGLSPGMREDKIVRAYRTSLQSCARTARSQYRARTAYVRVLDPDKERVKYHLVYLTTHPLGIVEFMEMSVKAHWVQRRVRAEKKTEARQRETGTVDMFSEELVTERMEASEDWILPSKVDSYWRRYLANGPRKIGVAEFADILEETNWLPTDLQESLMRLIGAGDVKNLDARGVSRKRNPLHYRKNETLQLVRDETARAA